MLFVVHWVEEYLTGFYAIDRLGTVLLADISRLNTPGFGFIVFQLLFWGMLALINLFLFFPRTGPFLVGLGATAALTEPHHIYKAISSGGYYPGLITAILFPPLIAFALYSVWRDMPRMRGSR